MVNDCWRRLALLTAEKGLSIAMRDPSFLAMGDPEQSQFLNWLAKNRNAIVAIRLTRILPDGNSQIDRTEYRVRGRVKL